MTITIREFINLLLRYDQDTKIGGAYITGKLYRELIFLKKRPIGSLCTPTDERDKEKKEADSVNWSYNYIEIIKIPTNKIDPTDYGYYLNKIKEILVEKDEEIEELLSDIEAKNESWEDE